MKTLFTAEALSRGHRDQTQHIMDEAHQTCPYLEVVGCHSAVTLLVD